MGMQPLFRLERDIDIVPRHRIGIGVVVDMLMPFVGTDNIADLISPARFVMSYPADPVLSRTEEQFRAIVAQKVAVPANPVVFPGSMGDIGRDMQFKRPIEHGNDLTTFRMNDP